MTLSLPAGAWTTQQLVAFLAQVSAARDAAGAVTVAAEAVAAATESEVGAVVVSGRVMASVGFPAGQVPAADLVACAEGTADRLRLADGTAAVVERARIERIDDAVLLVARSDGDFDAGERGMLRGMATVLGLTLELLNTLEAERVAREGQEEKTRQVSELLAHARMQRQVTLERISGIQRAIASRRDLAAVLDAITEAAGELLDSGIAVLQVRHPVTGEPVTSVRGLIGPPERILADGCLSSSGARLDPSETDRSVHIDNDVRRSAVGGALPGEDVQALMSLPVMLGTEVVGCLLLASRDVRRRYGLADQALGTTLVEHVSLALQDTGTVELLQQALAQARHQASHDSLTGLSNRDRFLEDLGASLLARPDPRIAVLFVDLDHFKMVNDTRGHTTGDRLLSLAAGRLRGALAAEDHVARMGGDEFAVLLRGVGSERLAMQIAHRVFGAVCDRAEILGEEVWVSCSIGVALADGGESAASVLARADLALYQAKRLGRGRVCLYDPSLGDGVLDRVDTETQLSRGLKRGEVVAHLQPIVDLGTGHPVGFEALARWEHPERGLIPPAQFIPVAEESGLIVELGRQVLRDACAATGRLRSRTGLPLRINVNLSPRQMQDEHLPQVILQALEAGGLAPDDLTLEVTESLLLEDDEVLDAAVARLSALGVRLALDDFGTGYSSISTLQRLPVHTLKIDRSFVARLGPVGAPDAPTARGGGGAFPAHDNRSRLVEAVVSLGSSLRLGVVAEGVETEDQRRALLDMGCTFAQGFLMARPMSEDAALAWLVGLPPAPVPSGTPGAGAGAPGSGAPVVPGPRRRSRAKGQADPRRPR